MTYLSYVYIWTFAFILLVYLHVTLRCNLTVPFFRVGGTTWGSQLCPSCNNQIKMTTFWCSPRVYVGKKKKWYTFIPQRLFVFIVMHDHVNISVNATQVSQSALVLRFIFGPFYRQSSFVKLNGACIDWLGYPHNPPGPNEQWDPPMRTSKCFPARFYWPFWNSSCRVLFTRFAHSLFLQCRDCSVMAACIWALSVFYCLPDWV